VYALPSNRGTKEVEGGWMPMPHLRISMVVSYASYAPASCIKLPEVVLHVKCWAAHGSAS
jgi:hypothetical protein